MLVLFICLATLALLASLLSLVLLYDADSGDDSKLMKLGFKLIINSGLLLVSLRYVVTIVNQKSLIETTCDELLKSNKYAQFQQLGCSIEQMNTINWADFYVTSLAGGLSWIVPFVFASVGVNALSQGLMSSSRGTPIVESFIARRSEGTQRKLRFLLSKFI